MSLTHYRHKKKYDTNCHRKHKKKYMTPAVIENYNHRSEFITAISIPKLAQQKGKYLIFQDQIKILI
jgi:hypothetical protein